MGDFRISVVIPVYNEGKELYSNVFTIQEALKQGVADAEIILVDDGSRDNTWEVMGKICSSAANVKALRLSRNFGKEAAISAGLEEAVGNACVIMDADLQHPPRLIPEMVRLWREEGFDVVDCCKEKHVRDTFLARVGAFLFYKAFKRLSGIDLKEACDFKLLDEKVVAAWKQMREYNTFFRGMAEWVGFNRTKICFTVPERSHGGTKWSFMRLYKLAVTAITSFSSMPLQIVTFMGMAFLFASLILGIQTLYMKFTGIAVDGFTTVILLLLITGSFIMISLGIIGTYIAKIYDEVKSRPRYIIREKKGGRG